MRNIKEIKDEIKSIESEIDSLAPPKTEHEFTAQQKVRKKAGVRIVFLRTCKRYLESKPTEDFVMNEILRIENKIIEYRRTYSTWFTMQPDHENLEPSKAKARFNQQIGLTELNSQISTMKYLLKQ